MNQPPLGSCPFCRAKTNATGYDALKRCGRCHAPLYTIVNDTRPGKGRNASRIPHMDRLEFILNWPPDTRYEAQAYNLSPLGLQFVSDLVLYRGERLLIRSNGLSAVAEVTRCERVLRRDTYATAVKFLTLELSNKRGTFLSQSA